MRPREGGADGTSEEVREGDGWGGRVKEKKGINLTLRQLIYYSLLCAVQE